MFHWRLGGNNDVDIAMCGLELGQTGQDRTGQQQDRLMLIGRGLSNGIKTVATHGPYDGTIYWSPAHCLCQQTIVLTF